MPLKLIRRHSSPFWYIRGSVRGKSVDESTRVADREQAEAIRAKREWEIVTRQIGGSRPVATFVEAAVSYMENGGEARFIEPILGHFKTTPLSDIGQAEVEACARRIYPDAGPATINRQVFTPVSAIMTHAAQRKLCDKPAFRRPTEPRGRVRWLTLAESDRLIGKAAPHLKPLLTFLFYTGARVGEALALDWREVDLTRASVIFLETKNGDRRGVPLHPRALVALANLKRRTGRVFLRPGRKTEKYPGPKPYADKEDGGGQIKRAFAGACRRAKIKDFHPHDCRHTWATWHYAANRDLAGLMKLGGWRTVQMVLRYAHVNVDDLAPGIMRIGENPGSAKIEGLPSPRKPGRSA